MATTNRGKVREIKAALSTLGWHFITLDQVQAPQPPPETGTSFGENAALKASYYCEQLGMAALADDSGLCIDALNGAPGVQTARIAGRSDEDRIDWILEQLKGIETEARTAHFACAICLQLSTRETIEVEGRVEGRITRTPRGQNGFGQDPIFLYPPEGKTFAELPLEEKNRVSHRAVAFRLLRQAILNRPSV